MTLEELRAQITTAQAELASIQVQLGILSSHLAMGTISQETYLANTTSLNQKATALNTQISSLKAQIAAVPSGFTTLVETYRGVGIWSTSAADRFWCQPTPGTMSFEYTLQGARSYVDLVLGPAPTGLPFVCPTCKTGFATAAQLEAHIASVHPSPPPPPPPPTDEEIEKARKATDLYNQANIIYQGFKIGDIPESSFRAQVDMINASLAALGYPAWEEPIVVTPPTPPLVAGAVTLDLDPMTELMKSYSYVRPMTESPAVAAGMQALTNDILARAGVDPQAIAEASRSPMDPATAATLGTAVALGCLTAVGALGAVGIAAESLSLGQLETVMTSVMKIVDTMGITQLGSGASMIQWETGVLEPARQYWLSVHQPTLPGAGDLIRFVVKEAITPDRFDELMGLQGFRSEFTGAYWAAHWRDISSEQAHEAMHKRIITREERDKYLVLLDYKPEPRPGIGKADRDIIAGLAKTPLPRVDVRRGFKLGEISLERMKEEYEGLGYEDNAELMTKIQARAAYESLQNSVLNEAMYMLSAGKITDADFEALFHQVRDTYDELTLWVTRAQLRKVRMAKPPAEEGAPPPSETELEEKLE